MDPGSDLRKPAGAVRAFALIAAAAGLLRLPLYLHPGVILGWNSDSAIYGLMARAMVQEHRPIFLFWGQDYLGTLTALWTLLAGAFLGEVGPLALRIGASLQIAVSITLCWCVFRKLWGSTVASIAAFWLIAGPKYFFDFSYAPLSAEQMLFVGSLILWHVTRAPMESFPDWLILGLLTGMAWWAHRGGVFATASFLVAHVITNRHRPAGHYIRSGVALVIGTAIGVIPLLAGLASIDGYLYRPLAVDATAMRVLARAGQTLTVDLWRFLGGDGGVLAIAASVMLIVFFIAGLRRVRWQRGEITAIGVIATSFIFWIVSPQAYSGATRYLALALPIFLAVAGLGCLDLAQTTNRVRRVAVLLCAAVISIHFYYGRITDVRAIAAGQRERFEHWPGAFDPRPALQEIDRAGYRVCYADFWVAYKLEWLSRSGTQFIPYRSVNRTQTRSLRLAQLPGPKCHVSTQGTVTALTPAQDAVFARETIEAVRRLERRSARSAG